MFSNIVKLPNALITEMLAISLQYMVFFLFTEGGCGLTSVGNL